ncbi:hypothetical protein [Parendozoicomonas haliclonae]|uniref:Isochorismatase family protein n=1 Tax=Parendozoicomonas haliclonae TaxID=1960125 RepID=A0A1X7AJ46_9GAMM|nr:hypothetical protein [Parendozoicomonas haliclonae]SMA44797.1 hypothetical protein EHSB41UT_01799 [Parendozoicomonas haliclonae]
MPEVSRSAPSGLTQPYLNSTPEKKESPATHFPNNLRPGSSNAVVAIPKPYTPDTSQPFYEELKKALDNNVKLVACLVDAYGCNTTEIGELVIFCRDHNIEILNVEFDIYSDHGKEISGIISSEFPEHTRTAIKSTQSIFSSPQTHHFLRQHAPDGIIIAGEHFNSCIRATTVGIKEGDPNHDMFGDEYGALEYGFPVYTHFGLIRETGSKQCHEEYKSFTNENYHRFEDDSWLMRE